MTGTMNAAVQALNFAKVDDGYIDFHECLECGRSLYNPVCPQCVADEFISWLDNFEKLNGKKEIIAEVKLFLSRHKNLNNHSEVCITCGKENLFMCPYCFTNYLWSLVKSHLYHFGLMEEFVVLFNFDFNHNGYWREAEILGVI